MRLAAQRLAGHRGGMAAERHHRIAACRAVYDGLRDEWQHAEQTIPRLAGLWAAAWSNPLWAVWKPTDEEKQKLLPILAATPLDTLAPTAKRQDRRAALEDLYWAVLTDREFLFNH